MFCKLLWRDISELVLVMERDPDCSMEILYELCESWLWEGIGEEISREQRDEEKGSIYNAGWSEEGKLFGKEMNLSF